MIYELLKCLFEFNNMVQVLFTIRMKMCKNLLLFEEGACFHSFRHQLLFLLWIGHPAGQLLLLRLNVTRVRHYLHYCDSIEKITVEN